jgi:hypothetical protein
MPELLFALALSAAGLGIAYWVIRLAVRHAMEDADYRRSSGKQ